MRKVGKRKTIRVKRTAKILFSSSLSPFTFAVSLFTSLVLLIQTLSFSFQMEEHGLRDDILLL